MSDHPRPSPAHRYDVVVVSYNQRERLLAGLASARDAAGDINLIVVDNNSHDGSAAAVRETFPEADLVSLDENIGFGPAVNRGTGRGNAPFILLLNNDARLRSDALGKLTEALNHPDRVAAGPLMLGPAGECELSINRTLSPWNEARFKLTEALYRGGNGPAAAAVQRRMGRLQEVRSLSGACILLERAAFEAIGGFDERFFLYAEDVDLCLRLRAAGGRLMFVPEAIVEHDRGASSATNPGPTAIHYRRSQIAFYRKHHGALATAALRLYLALRFSIGRVVGRSREKRQLAAELLRLTLRESGT
jgi:GT2 family glycosyltransferase